MSVAIKTEYDVFLSHGTHDTGIAGVVKNALSDADLEVFSVQSVKPENSFTELWRDALAECSAVVLILTRSTLGSSNLAFEVGAAMAWNKPIYVIHDGIADSEIPRYLDDLKLCQISNLPQIVKEIAKSQEPISEEDRETLMNVYEEFGIPTDQLLCKPLDLRELSEQYNKISHSILSGERLIRELIRLRKQGKLPRVLKRR